jgi:hypothetical protein
MPRLLPVAALLLTLLACGEDAPRVPSGTATMAARLAALHAAADPARDGYLSDKRVEMFRERLQRPGLSPAERVQMRVQLASELTTSGVPRAAVVELEAVLAETDGSEATVSDSMRVEVQELLALAWLRLGEQENCIAHHGTESCLFPIVGDGVHTSTEGSLAAIPILEAVLEERPKRLETAWLLNIAYMTLGRYPDDVPPQWLVPPEAFASADDIGRFVDVAAERGADVMGLCGGVCLEDFDGDGDLDILCSSWALVDQVRYLVNDGTGRFTDHTSTSGLLGITGGLNMLHADYDNDGDADVFMLRGAWRKQSGLFPNSLLPNNGDGTFDDVTEAAGMLSLHPTQTATWGDYDGDGWLDLFVGNETMQVGNNAHPCELYHNDGDGTFTEVAAACGVDLRGYVKGVVFGDYDDDGRPDLYVSRNDGPNVLLRNGGPLGGKAGSPAAPRALDGAPYERPAAAQFVPWRFVDVTEEAGVAEPEWSFPTWFFDYDNDGLLDLWVSGYRFNAVRQVCKDYLGRLHKGELPRLYHNRGDGTFEDVTAAAGMDTLLLTMGCNFGDLDNDGWLDLYAGTGEPDFRALYPNRMFRNDRGERFLDVTTSGGFGHLQKGHGVAFGDVDGDGDQDVYSVMGGALTGDAFQNALFLNPGHGHRWLSLRLQGVLSNRSAIGARIRARLDERGGPPDVHATVGTGGSFGSTCLAVELGLGEATSVTELEVRWPSGVVQTFADVAPDRVYALTEGESLVEVGAAPSR